MARNDLAAVLEAGAWSSELENLLSAVTPTLLGGWSKLSFGSGHPSRKNNIIPLCVPHFLLDRVGWGHL